MNRQHDTIESLFAVPQERMSSVDTVINKIKQLLIERRLKPGDPLPSESVLASSMGISRGPIREAMKVLSAFGVVEIRRGDGTYVATSANPRIFDPLIFSLLIHNTNPEELIQLREMIEMDVIRLIIRNATLEQIGELQDVHDKLTAAARDPAVADETLNELDVEFHTVMARVSNNRLVENIYRFIIGLFAPTISARHGAHTHARIIEAIANRDPALSETSEQEHIDAWRRAYHVREVDAAEAEEG